MIAHLSPLGQFLTGTGLAILIACAANTFADLCTRFLSLPEDRGQQGAETDGVGRVHNDRLTNGEAAHDCA